MATHTRHQHGTPLPQASPLLLLLLFMLTCMEVSIAASGVLVQMISVPQIAFGPGFIVSSSVGILGQCHRLQVPATVLCFQQCKQPLSVTATVAWAVAVHSTVASCPTSCGIQAVA